jgi:hypothetical protein
MDRDHPLLAQVDRRILVAVPFVLAALAVLVFDVLREIPLDYGCGESAPSGHEVEVSAYRTGADVLHLAAMGSTLVALAALTDRRGLGPFGLSWKTTFGAGLVVLSALVLAHWDALEGDVADVVPLLGMAGLPTFLVVVGIVELAGPGGPVATGAVAIVGLAFAAAWASSSVGSRTLALRVALWVLMILLGAHLALVYFQGDAPHLC